MSRQFGSYVVCYNSPLKWSTSLHLNPIKENELSSTKADYFTFRNFQITVMFFFILTLSSAVSHLQSFHLSWTQQKTLNGFSTLLPSNLLRIVIIALPHLLLSRLEGSCGGR